MEKAERTFQPIQYEEPSWTQVIAVCFGLNSISLTPAHFCTSCRTCPGHCEELTSQQSKEVKTAQGAQPFSPVSLRITHFRKACPSEQLSAHLLISVYGGRGSSCLPALPPPDFYGLRHSVWFPEHGHRLIHCAISTQQEELTWHFFPQLSKPSSNNSPAFVVVSFPLGKALPALGGDGSKATRVILSCWELSRGLPSSLGSQDQRK